MYYFKNYNINLSSVWYRIALNMIDYRPTHGTLNLTLDSCSAYMETYRYKVLGYNNVGKYFKYGNRS